MKRIALPLTLLLLAILVSVARADGKLFQRALVVDAPHTPDQRALVVFDAQQGTQTLVVETTAEIGDSDGPAELAWVIPLPARPEIEASTTGLFPTLETFCAPDVDDSPDPTWLLLLGFGVGACAALRWWGRPLKPLLALSIPTVTTVAAVLLTCVGFFPGCSATLGARSPPSGASVLDRQQVGVFDTTTLTATDAPALRRWLTDNGFAAPESIDPVVTDLLAEGWVFVASKTRVDPGGVARLHPLAFTFPTREAVYPMRLTGVDGEPLELELYVCGAGRAAADGLTVVHCDDAADAERRRFHGEYARRTAGAPVLTKLSGVLDVAAMQGDLVIRWEPFERHRTAWLTAGAAAHRAAAIGVLAALVVLLCAAVVSRRVAACASGRPTRFDVTALALALVAGVGSGSASYAVTPRVPEGATLVRPTHAGLWRLLSDPPDATAGNAEAVRAWVAEKTAGALNPMTGAPLREQDAPGGWWLQEDGERLEIVTWEWPQDVRRVDVSRLEPLVGSVVDADGHPVADAEIRLRATHPDRRAEPGQFFGSDVTTRTDAEGAFRVPLRAGRTWEMAVVPPDQPYALRQDVVVRDGAVDIVLPEATELRGRVVRGDGTPVAGVEIAAAIESPFTVREERFATTDEDGWFVIPGLDADTDDLLLKVHVHEQPECTARFRRNFRGRLPPPEPFVLTMDP